MKKRDFKPRKVGFLAWECEVKIPGKPKRYDRVRAWTKSGVERKALKKQADLLASYLMSKGTSTPSDPIFATLPEEIVNPPAPVSGPYAPSDPQELDPIVVEETRVASEEIAFYDRTPHRNYDVSTGETRSEE